MDEAVRAIVEEYARDRERIWKALKRAEHVAAHDYHRAKVRGWAEYKRAMAPIQRAYECCMAQAEAVRALEEKAE